jgi:YedE family putative selenium metabolism protein
MVLRLAAGDMTAVAGLAGLAAGIAVGVGFLRRGLEVASTPKTPVAAGYLLPAAAVALALLAYLRSGLLVFADSGPAAQHAPMALSLGSGLALGAIAQRSRFCVTGAFRNFFAGRDWSLMAGFAALALTALLANLFAGTFRLGYFDQPGSHPVVLWNFVGMFVAGLGSMVIGGCPFRQLTLAGEGDTGASLAILGMLGAAAASRAFGISSTVEGPTWTGKVVLLSCLVFLLAVGLAKTRE